MLLQSNHNLLKGAYVIANLLDLQAQSVHNNTAEKWLLQTRCSEKLVYTCQAQAYYGILELAQVNLLHKQTLYVHASNKK